MDNQDGPDALNTYIKLSSNKAMVLEIHKATAESLLRRKLSLSPFISSEQLSLARCLEML